MAAAQLLASGLRRPSLARLVFPPGKLPELTLGSTASFRLLQAAAKNFIDKAARERTVEPGNGADGVLLGARSVTSLGPTVVI